MLVLSSIFPDVKYDNLFSKENLFWGLSISLLIASWVSVKLPLSIFNNNLNESLSIAISPTPLILLKLGIFPSSSGFNLLGFLIPLSSEIKSSGSGIENHLSV